MYFNALYDLALSDLRGHFTSSSHSFLPATLLQRVTCFSSMLDSSHHESFVTLCTCAGDWMCPTPQIRLCRPDPRCHGIWRWDLWEVRRSQDVALVTVITACIRETPESSLASLAPCPMWRHSKKMAGPGIRLSTHTKSAGGLIWTAQSLELWEITFFCV